MFQSTHKGIQGIYMVLLLNDKSVWIGVEGLLQVRQVVLLLDDFSDAVGDEVAADCALSKGLDDFVLVHSHVECVQVLHKDIKHLLFAIRGLREC